LELEQHEPRGLGSPHVLAALLALLIATGITAGSALAITLPGSAPDTCTGAWNVIPSPAPPSALENHLNAVSVVSTADIWAVGYSRDSSTQVERTLVENWDGNSWSIVASPNPPGSDNNALEAVVALSASNVWATGFYTHWGQTLVEHWDGAAWSVVPSPNIGTNTNALWSLSAVSAGDTWAVGLYRTDSGAYQTLVEHWDGTAWSIVPSPNPSLANTSLTSVSAATTGDAWAAGRYYNISGVSQTLVEHWDGTAWSFVPSPNVGTGENNLWGVASISANNVWAVGRSAGGGNYQTLIEHWDGSAWQVVPSPNPGAFSNELSGIVAVSANDVWAVGDRADSPSQQPQTLAEHWDGTSWSPVASANIGPNGNFLNAVTAVSANDLVAVGYDGQQFGNARTLVERYTVPCASLLTGHVTWQGRPAQPNALQQIPVTLTLRSTITQATYLAQTTDPSGFFTVPVGTLPADTYSWRVEAPKYLANSGAFSLVAGATSTNVEMGLVKTGDANNDNRVNAVDFAILHNTYGKVAGDPGYDDRADFTGDHAVTAVDFSLMQSNFGQPGAPPLTPVRR
jgi:hypothetical protein